eukprot:1150751-Pelagomonas_calceolata.AAC.5
MTLAHEESSNACRNKCVQAQHSPAFWTSFLAAFARTDRVRPCITIIRHSLGSRLAIVHPLPQAHEQASVNAFRGLHLLVASAASAHWHLDRALKAYSPFLFSNHIYAEFQASLKV